MTSLFRSLYVPIDGSAHSGVALDVALSITRAFGGSVTLSHVYAARMHEGRFRQMEGVLPPNFQDPQKLGMLRSLHGGLIEKGLRVISEGYLDVAEKRCREAGVPVRRRVLEGKNYIRLAEDISSDGYDLVVMGGLGMGAVRESLVGSVCERVVRRIRTDVLVVRSRPVPGKGPILAAVDGSTASFRAMEVALALARGLGHPVEALSCYDPFLHQALFSMLAETLQEQGVNLSDAVGHEGLHRETIDGGLAQIYQAHLQRAEEIGSREGLPIRTALLQGKPFPAILRHTARTRPWLLAVGRTGYHSVNGLDLGSTTENLLRLAPCNLLVCASGREAGRGECAGVEPSR